MFSKRKKQEILSKKEMNKEQEKNELAVAPTYDEYISYLKRCESEINDELKAYSVAAKNLKVSAKRISRIRGVYSNKISRRKIKKHGVKIRNYKESLAAYADISSRISWLLDTHTSCSYAAASVTNKARAAMRLRSGAEAYSAKILYKKKKIESVTDGIVMPVATYVN